ncbi:MAG: hypothetical protein WAW96_09770, partial [Alphaproteobacteria bacterium]
MPILRAVLMIRHAISPRFAIKILENIKPLGQASRKRAYTRFLQILLRVMEHERGNKTDRPGNQSGDQDQ